MNKQPVVKQQRRTIPIEVEASFRCRSPRIKSGWACLVAAFTMAAGIGWAPESSGKPKVDVGWTCDLSARLATVPEKSSGRHATLAGGGLASCRTAQGFSFDVPVQAQMGVALKSRTNGAIVTDSTMAVSTTNRFAVARGFEELEDSFETIGAASSLASPEKKRLWARGQARNLVLDLEIGSSSAAFEKVDVKSLTLKIDEAAPALVSRL